MRAQKFEPVAGTVAALFFGALAWSGLQYIQSLLRRAGVLHTANLGNVKTILDIVQWVVIILMVGLVYMIWQRHHRKISFSTIRNDLRDIRHLNFYQFCGMAADAFRYDGWLVHENTDDEGPDLVLRKPNHPQTLVWCKFWRLPVTEHMMSEVIEWSERYQSVSKVVSMKGLTTAASLLAAQHNIEVLGRAQIVEWKRAVTDVRYAD